MSFPIATVIFAVYVVLILKLAAVVGRMLARRDQK